MLLEQAVITDVPIMPSSWLYNPSSQVIQYNKAEARKILNEAGWNEINGQGILGKDIEGKRHLLSFELLINVIMN